MANSSLNKNQWVLVEGPGPDEAEFLGRWLLAAAAADKALKEQFKRNAELKKHISSVEIVDEVCFSSGAAKFLELLMKDLTAFSLSVEDVWIDVFAIMADLGFFRLTGERYQMTLPSSASGSAIEAALLKLAATEHRFSLHPENMIHWITKYDAHTWHARLKGLTWMQRVADRELLLGDG
ncbi:hypothetical protein [Bradyrhizobium betae]|uniref:Uncharacterized protein n=1 Tax=Bradyrhizobium betae TaxID=244734 RepID=A0A5P6PF17_9BRAD|nr:hypothetical protein [Bradyrhizobium betae]MCS3726189.1 hypothetical protein [Bradyrhizobium betae]QFI76738.1 hypothetical protein F8237_32660 [Bradyrhizobium betae]